MANPEYCQQIYVIKRISGKSSKHPNCGVPNPMKFDKEECDDSDSDPEFNPKQFWIENDKYNYYLGHEINLDTKKMNITNTSTSTILWIDTTTNLKEIIEKKLPKQSNIKIDFYQNYFDGADYLVQNADDIRSLKYQMVCLAYYHNEDKSALNLLDLLNDLHLDSIPILVVTKSKARVISHLDTQAKEIDLYNWRERIFITDDVNELAQQLEKNTK